MADCQTWSCFHLYKWWSPPPWRTEPWSCWPTCASHCTEDLCTWYWPSTVSCSGVWTSLSSTFWLSMRMEPYQVLASRIDDSAAIGCYASKCHATWRSSPSPIAAPDSWPSSTSDYLSLLFFECRLSQLYHRRLSVSKDQTKLADPLTLSDQHLPLVYRRLYWHCVW